MVGEDASIRQAILLLLTTMPGERVMRPEYGCELFTLVFSPNDETTAGLAIHYVRRALARWEPRIEIVRLDASRDPAEPGLLNVDLEYRVRATQRHGVVVISVDLTGGAR
jgi:phage baseplate assembly protein W